MAKSEPPVQRQLSPSEDPRNLLEGALSPDEMELCQNVVVFGVEYLRNAKGWKADAVERFLRRVPVRHHIESLQRQYTDRTGIQERTQFFAQLRINTMVPAAINTLAKALRGAYVDPNSGDPVPPPTRGQFEAALEVLNRSNIQGSKWGGNDATPAIDARTVQIALGGSADPMAGLSGESREKLRRLLSAVSSRARTIAQSSPAAPKARPVTTAATEVADDEDPSESRDG